MSGTPDPIVGPLPTDEGSSMTRTTHLTLAAFVLASLAACSGEPPGNSPGSGGTPGTPSGGTAGTSSGGAGASSGGASGGTVGGAGAGGVGDAGMSGGGGTSTGGSGGGGGAPTCESLTMDAMGNVVVPVSEAQNYTFSSSLSISVTPVAPKSDLTFDWSAVTKDFMDHELNPATDVEHVAVLVWELSHAALEEGINNDSLKQKSLLTGARLDPADGVTSANLFSFGAITGQPIEPEQILEFLDPTLYPPEAFTYLVVLSSSTEIGREARMLKAFRLDASTTNTSVALDPTSALLTYQADIVGRQTTPVPVGKANLYVDWSQLATNAFGRDFVDTKIDEVMVARFTETPAELQADFLDLELNAEDMYRGQVTAGESLVLTNLTHSVTNAPFPGIDATSTWLLVLRCGSCMNPAPWYLTVLSPCP